MRQKIGPLPASDAGVAVTAGPDVAGEPDATVAVAGELLEPLPPPHATATPSAAQRTRANAVFRMDVYRCGAASRYAANTASARPVTWCITGVSAISRWFSLTNCSVSWLLAPL